MPWPEGSRGEHDAPLPMGKRSRGERDAPRTSKPTGQHLYLIFDDWPWGYSIRKLKLPIRSPHLPSLRPLEQRRLRRPEHKRLPPPCICLEAIRCHPLFFAAVGTNIIAVHPRKDLFYAPVPECILPIVDVSSMGVWFGPGLLYPELPILITVSDEVFALGMESFRMLSLKPFCPRGSWCDLPRPPKSEWSWCDLPRPPLDSMDVTSFAVGDDGRTIFASTNCATFAFDIVNCKWKQFSNCSLPFVGPANYVHALDIFVGLSNAPDAYGHLCFCRELGVDQNVCKENLFSKDPANHLGASLVCLGGSEPWFCLVECVWLEECDQLVKCVDEGTGNCGELDQLKKNVDKGDGASGSMQECGEQDELKKFLDEECGEQDELKKFLNEGDGVSGSMQECGELDELNKFVDEEVGVSGSKHFRYLYRLTTFSLSFDNNGDLTTGETCVVQYYKVPEKVSAAIHLNPVAFWL